MKRICERWFNAKCATLLQLILETLPNFKTDWNKFENDIDKISINGNIVKIRNLNSHNTWCGGRKKNYEDDSDFVFMTPQFFLTKLLLHDNGTDHKYKQQHQQQFFWMTNQQQHLFSCWQQQNWNRWRNDMTSKHFLFFSKVGICCKFFKRRRADDDCSMSIAG